MKCRIAFVLSFFMASTGTVFSAAYEEDFNSGDGGWVPVDLNAQDIYWQHAIYDNRSVAWVGTDGPGLDTPPGYGNDWVQYLTKEFHLSPGGNTVLSFSIQYDTEFGFDFCRLQVSENGGEFMSILSFDGLSTGFEEVDYDLGIYAGSDVAVRFSFTSDDSFSDEDGLFDSDGACRLDWVELDSRDDFDGGLDGWASSTLPSLGYAFRLEEIPCGSEPQELCDDWPFDWSWVAYEEESGEFPNTSEEQWMAGIEVRLGIESPVIPITPTAGSYTLEFDVYNNLPVENGVFYSFEVAAPPGDDYQSFGFLYFSDEGEGRHESFDITGLVSPGADEIQVRLTAGTLNQILDELGLLSGEHTAAPWFDNVCIRTGDEFCDADDDLVPDEDDLCLGTRPGEAVDENGCSDLQVDSDGDGFCNPDAPGVGPSGCMGSDEFPDDPGEWSDNDGDGTGDNADPDDDNDGQTDSDEIACGSDPLDAGSLADDTDSDGVADCVDPDDDNDLVLDGDDACPDTTIPDGAPSSAAGLAANRWSLLGNTDGNFTQGPPQGGSSLNFTTADTNGCSCEQIVLAWDLGEGVMNFGCPTGIMLEWSR